MRILAIDTATEACSVALLDYSGQAQAERLFVRQEIGGKSHANQILGMVDSVLAEALVALNALDGIAASIGPGAFTGVRISVAVAQGLAFGAALPVVPISTLEALALNAVRHGAARTLVCLDARMGEVYWGCFAADAARGVIATTAPGVGPPDTVRVPESRGGERYIGIGRGFSAYPTLAAMTGVQLSATAAQSLPHAADFARLAALRFALGEAIDAAELSPRYLRDKVALTEVERARVRAE
jgi:tRNA threonylcarbamoyladenosine biosynthesis protein TsaB